MKLFLHKLFNWEYWSVNVVYAPTFFLWVGFMVKFRAIKFYKYSNLAIKNGGFNFDCKSEIYKLLPQEIYPKTILIEAKNNSNFEKIILKNKLKFPLIVKPDVGLRGIGVDKVLSIKELNEYCKHIKQDFLIQEIIDYPNEIGLFYCKIPNDVKGKITGITVKYFLTIEGNGIENLENLLKKTPRYRFQIPKLKEKFNLNEIVPKGVSRCLVPFGNHNRGTMFLDGKELITKELEESFNKILGPIDGFNYGRLDIKYNSIEDLMLGKNFSIIEVNGAKSEPTHIYDPKHSFWYGQKEILRHQMIFYQIVKQNYMKVNKL
jgi:hypothetical protein